MRASNDDESPRGSARESLLLLTFGLAVLAFLVAIDRPHWFHIRPMTGTAAAMSLAAETDQRPGPTDAGSARPAS